MREKINLRQAIDKIHEYKSSTNCTIISAIRHVMKSFDVVTNFGRPPTEISLSTTYSKIYGQRITRTRSTSKPKNDSSDLLQNILQITNMKLTDRAKIICISELLK